MSQAAADPDFVTQSLERPAFESLLWSRPERSQSSGKLLIIGSNSQQFAATQTAYQLAVQAGIGQAKVVMPSSLQSLIGAAEDIEFVPSTPSGSIAESSLAQLKQYLNWADGMLLPGELSANSETELVIAKLLQTAGRPVVASHELSELLWRNLDSIAAEQLAVVGDYRSIQKLIVAQKLPVMLKRDDPPGVARQVALEVHRLAKLSIVIEQQQQLIVASQGRLSQTSAVLSAELLANCAVLVTQFPTRSFEALTSAVYLSVTD